MNPKVLLCQFDNLEFYSYMILSAQLIEKGVEHDVEIIDDDVSFLNKLSGVYGDYEIIGFYTCNTDYIRIMRLVKEIKKRFTDKAVILGGPHPTINYEKINFDLVDFVCVGDGEFHFAEWVNSRHYMKKRNYYNIVCDPSMPFKTEFVQDLNKSPIPNRDIYYSKYPFLRRMGIRRFLLSSGCPFKCTYCYNETFRNKFDDSYSKVVLFKNPEKAIEEIENVLEKYPAEAVSFSDDNFCINRKWLFSFLKLYSERINKPFHAATTITAINDEVIEKLHKSNLKILRIAMETTNFRIRSEILHRPKYTNEQFSEIVTKIRKKKIKVIILNMFCLPTQTLQDCVDIFNFAIDHKLIMCTTILVPYKGTAMYDYCLENDLLIDPSGKEGDLNSSWTSLKGVEMERMVTMQNYTFILNFIRFMIPVILFMSKFTWFRYLSFKLISPVNVIGMNFYAWTGLFSLKKLFELGIKTFRIYKRKN